MTLIKIIEVGSNFRTKQPCFRSPALFYLRSNFFFKLPNRLQQW